MDAKTENDLRTREANYNLRLARKNESVMICQTLQGNVRIDFSAGAYTVTKLLTLDDYIRDENAQAPILARGTKSEVLETVKALFEIVEE